MGRCTGHCCRAFALPYSPDQLRRAREVWEAYLAADAPEVFDWPSDVAVPEDVDIIEPMVIHLGEFTRNPLFDGDGDAPVAPSHFYTCRNLSESGDCTIYEDRPKMCRGYPYGRECRFPGCTLDACGSTTIEAVPDESPMEIAT